MLLSVCLMLLVSTIAIAAAQSSLPGRALYPVKVWTEDLRLIMNKGNQEDYQLALQFTNRRLQEIQALVQSENVFPLSLIERYRLQAELAISRAAGKSPEQALPALISIQERLTLHFQMIDQLRLRYAHNPNVLPALNQAREMLQLHLNEVESILANPAFLKLRNRQSTPAPSLADPSARPGVSMPGGTPQPGSEIAVTPGGCSSCPSGGSPGASSPLPGGGQPTQAGPQTTQFSCGFQPTPAGPQTTNEDQPLSPLQEPGPHPGGPKGNGGKSRR